MARKINVRNTIISAAVGAAAGAATVALSNKDNREKIGKAVANVTKRAQEITHDLNHSAKPLTKTAKRIGGELLDDAKKSSKPAVKRAKEAKSEVEKKLN